MSAARVKDVAGATLYWAAVFAAIGVWTVAIMRFEHRRQQRAEATNAGTCVILWRLTRTAQDSLDVGLTRPDCLPHAPGRQP